MLSRPPRSRSVAASRGRMKVVSDRFISFAIETISSSLKPRPSEKTARELPSRGLDVKTSHCVIASRRICDPMRIPCNNFSCAQVEMLTGDTKMQEKGYRRAIRRTSADAWRLTAAFAAFILTACQFLLPPAYYRLPNVLLL